MDKRIQELKAVQFWLDQNATALKATIQAMEVQKMTLSTLQGMNVNMADLAKAFTASVPTAVTPTAPVAPAAPASTPAPTPEPVPTEPESIAAAKPAVDPMQWWGSLTEQFQNIAAAALKDVAAQALKDGPKKTSTPSAMSGTTAPKSKAKAAATKSTARKTPAKAAAKKSAVPRKRA